MQPPATTLGQSKYSPLNATQRTNGDFKIIAKHKNRLSIKNEKKTLVFKSVQASVGDMMY